MAPQLFINSLATRLRRLVKQKPPVPVIEFQELVNLIVVTDVDVSLLEFLAMISEALDEVKDVLVDSKDSWLLNHLFLSHYDPRVLFYVLFNDNFIFSSPASRPAAGAKKSGPLIVQPPSQRRLHLLDSTLEAVFEMFRVNRERTDPFEERTAEAVDGRVRSVLLDFNWRKMIRKTPEDVRDVMRLVGWICILLSLCHKKTASDSTGVLEMEGEGILRQLGTLFKEHVLLDDGCVIPFVDLQSDETKFFSEPSLNCSSILQFELLAETCDPTVFFYFAVELEKEGNVLTFMNYFAPTVALAFNETLVRNAIEYMPKTRAGFDDARLTGIAHSAVIGLGALIGAVKETREERMNKAIGATDAETVQKSKLILMICFLSFKGFLFLSRRIKSKFNVGEVGRCLCQLYYSLVWALDNAGDRNLSPVRLFPIVLLALEWVNKLKTHKHADDTLEQLATLISFSFCGFLWRVSGPKTWPTKWRSFSTTTRSHIRKWRVRKTRPCMWRSC